MFTPHLPARLFSPYRMKLLFTREAHKADAATGLAPIYLRITVGFGVERPGKRREGMRREVATGVLAKGSEWDQDAQKIKGSSARAALSNAQLTDWRQAADELYRDLKKDNPNVTAEEVKRALKPRAVQLVTTPRATVAQGIALFLAHMESDGMGKSENTLQTYKTRAANLGLFFADYAQQMGMEGQRIGVDYPLEEVRLPVARALERWCLGPHPTSGAPRFGHMAMRKQVNMLQMVVGHAAMEGLVPTNTLHGYKYQSKGEAETPRFLTAADLATLRAAEFADDHLNAVKDMFLFCAAVGLSYVDYVAFTKSPGRYLFQEQTENGPCVVWLRMKRQKMRKRKAHGFSVPLFDEAALILVRRRGRLPVRLNANANRFLKDIAQELGLSLPDLTFKDSRSTFAQHWRDKRVSSAVIAAMLGNTERMVNKEYSSVRETTILNEMGGLL